MFRNLLYIYFLTAAFTVNAQPDQRRLSPAEYISLYKEMAVVNMNEKKVPASITLAQAMFESDFGNSPLAREARNHFGIKCHDVWNGATYHQDDDAKDECFRKYDNPLQSFQDHSDFLLSRQRYNFLFDLDITDYKGWARGLKTAGYATNPNYPARLIDIIERYQLYYLDEGKELPVCNSGEEMASKEGQKSKPSTVKEYFYKAPPLAPEGFINDVPYIISRKGDTYFSVSKRKEMMFWQVLKYNDADKNDILKEGEIVFLKPKRFSAKEEFHIVKSGESLRDISQLHGVKLNRLYKNNKLMPGQELTAGQKVSLK